MDYKQSFYSPGKLLITGEYLVIDGAKAFALPTKKGQRLSIKPSSHLEIHWTSVDANGQTWFEGLFNSHDFSTVHSTNTEIASRLSNILKAANHLDQSNSLQNGWIVRTELEFPNNWGLGSSSTLLCNVAKWLDIDAFKLHFTVSNGSGYDIASGMENKPLFYEVHDQKTSVELVSFNPSFKHQIYFVHLNQKQTSDTEVQKYSELKKGLDLTPIIADINRLTNEVLTATHLAAFENALTQHEQILSYVLQRETSQETLFQMYRGGITKYLGAWGGDFVLVTAKEEADLDYFKAKGYQTILTYSDMIAD